uniref:ABC transporter permease n=1 Tax=Bosea sp. NBC_00436 TaxID=2969620 RepID=A0A9E7ZTI5_9HYPH
MIDARARRGLGFYAAAVCVFSLLPVAAIVAESFTATNYIVFPPQGFTLKWYAAIADRPEFLQSAITSLIVACGASVIATVLGTLSAIALSRFSFPGRQALQSLFMAPLSLPGLIFGLALLQFFTARDLPRDIPALMIGHIVITMPFAIRFVTVSLTGVNATVELAAQSLGAPPLTAFRLITLPLIRSGIIASLLFSFILSFDDVAVSLFLSNANATTLPVRIYTYIDQNYDPLVTAVSALVVFLAFLVLATIERVMGLGRMFGIR